MINDAWYEKNSMDAFLHKFTTNMKEERQKDKRI
jgi:hypothetical protein